MAKIRRSLTRHLANGLVITWGTARKERKEAWIVIVLYTADVLRALRHTWIIYRLNSSEIPHVLNANPMQFQSYNLRDAIQLASLPCDLTPLPDSPSKENIDFCRQPVVSKFTSILRWFTEWSRSILIRLQLSSMAHYRYFLCKKLKMFLLYRDLSLHRKVRVLCFALPVPVIHSTRF